MTDDNDGRRLLEEKQNVLLALARELNKRGISPDVFATHVLGAFKKISLMDLTWNVMRLQDAEERSATADAALERSQAKVAAFLKAQAQERAAADAARTVVHPPKPYVVIFTQQVTVDVDVTATSIAEAEELAKKAYTEMPDDQWRERLDPTDDDAEILSVEAE